jgi:hypothetical protein
MKIKQIFVVAFLALAFSSNAQIFSPYKRAINRAEKETDDLKQQWPIVIDPIERVPQNVSNTFAASSPDNWGVRIVLPDSIKQRLQAECKGKVVVKVYDTSGGTAHPALQQGQMPGSNYTGSVSLPDAQGHGTHCAGIIAADGFGVLDALIDNGTIRWKPVKILGDNGSGSFDWFKNAVNGETSEDRALIAQGWSVVCNGSFGGGTALVPNVENALRASTDIGVIYLIAAGNTGANGVQYPGNSPYSIACASLDDNLKQSSYSTTGVELAVAMPGRNILSTYLNGQYATLSGTSMATPFLTACAAIAKSKYGNLIPDYKAMRKYLCFVATDLETQGRDNLTGWGIDYVRGILNTNPTKVPPTFNDQPGSGNPADPNPQPVKREYRTIEYTVTGDWSIFWGPSGSASLDAATMKTTSKKAKDAALNTAKITAVKLEYSTNDFAEKSSADINTNVRSFFAGRGFILPNPCDFADAVFWSAYFLDMILTQDKKQTVKILSIEGNDGKGNKAAFNASQIKRWPVGSN